MGKQTTIDSFIKRKISEVSPLAPLVEECAPKTPRMEPSISFVDINFLERDPALRLQIFEYPVNQRDEIRRSYISLGPYRGTGKFPYSQKGTDHKRCFNSSWFKLFPSWLEYSPTKDAAFCLPCYLFCSPKDRDTFTSEGFQNWRRAIDGKQGAFLKHEGSIPTSLHKCALQKCHDLMDQRQHIEKALSQQCAQQIANNQLRLKVSIFCVRWLTFQGCALRGNDENDASINRGNFIEAIKGCAFFSNEVKEVVLEKAPQNATYTSPDIQKDILSCISNQVRRKICEEIGDAKFCILVDEARDISKKEQMALVLRFIDKEGIVRERFFGVFHVLDTSAPTLRDAIYFSLSSYNLGIQSIRGQGYDGASNMRGAWNGLQALISKDSPSAYYVHCMAHRLQLALVAASHDVVFAQHFFTDLTLIVNIISASCKRNDQLKAAKASEIEYLIASGDLKTGTGKNQIGSLQRAGDTRWSSHLQSVSSLLKMFSPTCEVLITLIEEGTSSTQRAEAVKAYELLTSFQFVLLLHIMQEVFEITDLLCKALQCKSQDIVNAMHLVSSTKELLQRLRETGWDALFDKVKLFCHQRNMDIPDMSAQYVRRVPSRRHNQPQITMEHHYRVDIFIATIDSQLQELNNRFNENAMELLVLAAALDPRDGYKSFDVERILRLAGQFYHQDFSENEQVTLRRELNHYILDVPRRPELNNLSSLSELCQVLTSSKKSLIYPLVDRLIRLVLTLPVSTATTERAFSAMNIAKNRLRNKMEDDYLSNYLMVHIEREIAETLSFDSTIKEFASTKERRSQFF